MVGDVGEVLRDVGLTDGFEEEEEREEKVWIHCVVGGKDGEGDDQVGDAQVSSDGFDKFAPCRILHTYLTYHV